MVLFVFFLLTCIKLTILIFHISFFYALRFLFTLPCKAKGIQHALGAAGAADGSTWSFVLHISILPSHKSKMINSFRIIIVKIIIININIVKVYSAKTYIIAKECNNITIYISKALLKNMAFSSFSVFLLITNQSGTNFNENR